MFSRFAVLGTAGILLAITLYYHGNNFTMNHSVVPDLNESWVGLQQITQSLTVTEMDTISTLTLYDTSSGSDVAFIHSSSTVEQSPLDHYDAYPDNHNHHHHHVPIPRRLSASSALIGTFYPLTCNANLSLLDCSLNKTSTLTIPLSGNPFTIPCGTCYTFDLGSNVTFPTGLRVMGKLVFPVNYLTHIYTTFVLVQGEMMIRSNSTIISPDKLSVHFILTGTNDTILDMSSISSAPNTLACSNASVCNVGKKPFIVAGGKVDIQAFPSTCMSWTKIKDTVLQKPVKNSSLFKSMVYPPSTCTNPNVTLFQNNSASFASNVTGVSVGYNLTSLILSSCVISNQDYLVNARIRIDKADGTSNGSPTLCLVNGTSFCPRLRTRIGLLPSGESTSSLFTMVSRYAGNYGQVVDFTATIRWTASQVNVTTIKYWMLYFDQLESASILTVYNLTLSLPDSSSYLNPNDVCQELLPNGNAEGNGINPYPFYSSRSSEMGRVVNENGNNFFRLANRNIYSSTINANVDTRCFDLGVTYFATAKIRIQSDFPQSYYILLTVQASEGNSFDRVILQCPSQSRSNGWVTCSGEFTIDFALSRAVSAVWKLYLSNQRDGYLYTMEYDDLSIRYVRGYVDKVLVDSVDTSCWGAGSDLHITSSTFYNDGTPLIPNGYKGKITQVIEGGNGDQFLQINPAPTIPILSQSDSSLYAAEVALLTRNVVIEGSNNEGNGKGGYVQVLHTPNISQTIQGVQFVNMGRLSEFDHFVSLMRSSVDFSISN